MSKPRQARLGHGTFIKFEASPSGIMTLIPLSPPKQIKRTLRKKGIFLSEG